MFDIGFWELILISIIGLVILGPDRLPIAVHTVRNWITGARKFSDTVKSELTEELRVHQLHENLKKAEQTDLQNLSPEVAESLKTLKEAAASVSEPFKKVDTQALNSMMSSSLIPSAVIKPDSNEASASQRIGGKAIEAEVVVEPTIVSVTSECDKSQL
jgi:sec-independent protein translocase protein TatB